MEKIDLFEQYLGTIAPIAAGPASELSDDTFINVIAVLFRDGMIEKINWNSPMGILLYQAIDERLS